MSRSGVPVPPSVTIHIDERAVRVPSGISVAAALIQQDVAAFRVSAGGDTRGPLCGMGTCYECRVTIDGVAHRRACLIPVTEGMQVATGATGIVAGSRP